MNVKMPFDLESIVQDVSKLTLKGGLAGKICHVLIFVVIAVAAVAWSVKLLIVAIVSLCIIFVLPLLTLWRLIDLAHKNPQSALMEGAEFLLHEQMMIGTKEQPEIYLTTGEAVSRGPLELSPAQRLMLDQPEEETPKSLLPDNPDAEEAN